MRKLRQIFSTSVRRYQDLNYSLYSPIKKILSDDLCIFEKYVSYIDNFYYFFNPEKKLVMVLKGSYCGTIVLVEYSI